MHDFFQRKLCGEVRGGRGEDLVGRTKAGLVGFICTCNMGASDGALAKRSAGEYFGVGKAVGKILPGEFPIEAAMNFAREAAKRLQMRVLALSGEAEGTGGKASASGASQYCHAE